jgi:hypothetical protein
VDSSQQLPDPSSVVLSKEPVENSEDASDLQLPALTSTSGIRSDELAEEPEQRVSLGTEPEGTSSLQS